MFRRLPPIHYTIDEYTSWKYERHPMQAGGQRALLHRFVQSFNIQSVEEITDVQIAFFVGEELSAYYGAYATKAIRGFLHFCVLAGYEVVSWRMVTEGNLKKVAGRPTDWDMVRQVRELREGEKRLTFQAIADYLTGRGRKVHKTSAVRWYKQASRLP